MTTFAEWLAASNQQRVFLVEFEVEEIASGTTTALYFSNIPYYAADRQYLPCLAAIPTISRDSGDLSEPGRLPTYGDIELFIKPEFKPDPQCSLEWNLLLFQDDYTFQGQAITVKMGGPDMDFSEFQTIFTGFIGEINWGDYNLVLTVYDKLRFLEVSIPDYEIPETGSVVQDAWGAIPPLPLGHVKNMSPLYLSQPSENYGKFVLGYGPVESVLNVYQNNVLMGTGYWTFTQKDVSPAVLDAEGTFRIETFGPYTGPAIQQRWLVQIDDVTEGTEVGQATFRWSLDDGATWEDEKLSTWNLEYNPDTLRKTVHVGNATLVISGTYAPNPTAAPKYELVISTEGSGIIGTPPYPKIKWRKDGGAWSSEIDLDAADHDYDLEEGLTFQFSTTAIYIEPTFHAGAYVTDEADAPGIYAVPYPGTTPATVVHLRVDKVLQSFYCYGSAWGGWEGSWYKEGETEWGQSYDMPASQGTYQLDLVDADMRLTFTNGWRNVEGWEGFTVPGADPCTGISWDLTPMTGGVTVALNDAWEFYCSRQVPIDLADGVSVQFYTMTGQDFELGDNAEFLLWSTLTVQYDPDAGNAITCDVEGLLDANGDYHSEIIPVLQMMLEQFCGWESTDFDSDLMDAFAAEFPVTVGYLIEDVITVNEAINNLLTGFPAIYSVDLLGKFYVQELVLPGGGTPDLTISAAQNELTDLPEGNVPEQSPKKRVLLQYNKNWTVEKNPVGVTTDRAEWVRREYRQVIARDRRIISTYPTAGDLGPLESCVVARVDAQDLADRHLALFKDYHGFLTIQCEAKVALLKPGDLVELVRDKFGLDSGLTFLVTGTDFEPLANSYELTLWR